MTLGVEASSTVRATTFMPGPGSGSSTSCLNTTISTSVVPTAEVRIRSIIVRMATSGSGTLSGKVWASTQLTGATYALSWTAGQTLVLPVPTVVVQAGTAIKFSVFCASGGTGANVILDTSTNALTTWNPTHAINGWGATLNSNPGADVDITGWESNSALGGFQPANLTRSTAQAYGGSAASVLATFPTAGNSFVNQLQNPVTPGTPYLYSAQVYLPSGTSPATARMTSAFYFSGEIFTPPKNQWSLVSGVHIPTASSTFFGVVFESVAVGQTAYVDELRIQPSILVQFADNASGQIASASGDNLPSTTSTTGHLGVGAGIEALR